MNAQLQDAQTAKFFILGGKAIFTLRSRTSGSHFTYKVSEAAKRNPNDLPFYFVNVLTGPDNTSNYCYLGYIKNGQFFHGGAKAKISKDAPSFIAFDWSFRSIVVGKIPTTLEIWHEGRCAKCGRKLTVPESIASGFGPECGERMNLPISQKSASKSHNSPAASQAKFERMRKFCNDNDNMSDGAFFAFAEELGFTTDDWAWYSEREKAQETNPISKENV
jgi:hypothetical protein